MATATTITAVAAAAVMSVAAASPLIPPLGRCGGADCPATWPATAHEGDITGRDTAVNVFVGGEYRVNGRAAEAEGRIVVLGNLVVSRNGGGPFAMGAVNSGAQVAPPNGSDFVTVGGNVKVESGSRVVVGGHDGKGPASGNLRYADGLSLGGTIEPGLHPVNDPRAVAPYRDLLTRIEEASDCTAKAAANGTVTVSNGEAVFTGDGTSTRQVFNLTENLGSTDASVGLVFTGIPAGATVVVNVLLDDAIINTRATTGRSRTPATELRSKLLWNFRASSSVKIIGDDQFQGSVMVGNTAATTLVATAGLNGRVYVAGDLVQSGFGGSEIHSYPFEGELPDCKEAPGQVTGSVVPSPRASTSPTASTPAGHRSVPPSPTAANSPTGAASSRPTPATSGPTPASSSPTPSASPTPQAGGGGALASAGAADPVVLGVIGATLLGIGGGAVLVGVRRKRRS